VVVEWITEVDLVGKREYFNRVQAPLVKWGSPGKSKGAYRPGSSPTEPLFFTFSEGCSGRMDKCG
jgi:hypothetical protein